MGPEGVGCSSAQGLEPAPALRAELEPWAGGEGGEARRREGWGLGEGLQAWRGFPAPSAGRHTATSLPPRGRSPGPRGGRAIPGPEGTGHGGDDTGDSAGERVPAYRGHRHWKNLICSVLRLGLELDFRDFEAQARSTRPSASHGSGLSCSEPGLVCGAHPWADLGVGSRANLGAGRAGP